MATVSSTVDPIAMAVPIPTLSPMPPSPPSSDRPVERVAIGPPIATGPVLSPLVVFPANWTFADLQTHLGDIPAERIRMSPPPGYATEQDVVKLLENKDGLFELVDGVLVEKPMGLFESRVAAMLIYYLEAYLRDNPLGLTLSPDGPVRTVVPQVRMPDVCFVRWDHFAEEELPDIKVLPFGPDLAVEIISQSNTHREMERKLDEYFQSNTQRVWYIEPASKSARIYTARDAFTTISGDEPLDGGDLLPGFRVTLTELFSAARKKRQKRAD
jgi:Uma2 family endonuclease